MKGGLKLEKLRLTKSEEEVMEIFWKENKPLTSIQISEFLGNTDTTGKYLHKILKSLEQKGLIEVCGAVQYGTQYARQFKLAMTPEEFMTKNISSQGFGDHYFGKIGVALVRESSKKNDKEANDELISELEKMIEELKMRKD